MSTAQHKTDWLCRGASDVNRLDLREEPDRVRWAPLPLPLPRVNQSRREPDLSRGTDLVFSLYSVALTKPLRTDAPAGFGFPQPPSMQIKSALQPQSKQHNQQEENLNAEADCAMKRGWQRKRNGSGRVCSRECSMQKPWALGTLRSAGNSREL